MTGSAPVSNVVLVTVDSLRSDAMYHRTDDPGHEHDCYESGEVPLDVSERLETAIERHVSRLGGETAPQATVGDGTARRLDAFGYQ